MPFSNANMPCILLCRAAFIVLFYCGAPSPAQHASDGPLIPTPHTCGDHTQLNWCLQRCNLSHRHAMPWFTPTVLAPYHTIVCTLCPESLTTPRNLLLLFSVPKAQDDQFLYPLAVPLSYSSSVPQMM
jgi:hypothetical protein